MKPKQYPFEVTLYDFNLKQEQCYIITYTAFNFVIFTCKCMFQILT